MLTPASYEYAWLRVVPRVETGEFVNVGVILFCRTLRFMDLRINCNRARIAALAPRMDLDELERQLALLPALVAGKGPVGGLGTAEVFHWIVAPHSTVLQSSPVHAGITTDPAAALERLAATLHE